MTPVKRKLKAGDYLYKEGEAATSFYVILSGVLSLGFERGGRIVETSRLTTNAIAGDMFYGSIQARTTFARAVTEVEVVGFPFDQIQGDIKALPGWTQLMLKTFGDRLLEAEKEIRILCREENAPVGSGDVMRTIAGLRLAFDSLELEAGGLSWEKTREYLLQTVQVPALKALPVIRSLQEAGWIAAEFQSSELVSVANPKLDAMKELESFLRHYRSSRTKKVMLEMNSTDLLALRALCTAASGKADPFRGIARVPLSVALEIARELPGGASFRVEHFDLLQARGLDLIKESTENGLNASFNLADFEKIRSFWGILSSAQAVA